MELSDLTGRLVSARVVNSEDEVTCISVNGIILRTAVTSISRQGRYSRGVSVMDMKGNDMVASVAIIREGHLSRVNEERPENGQEEGSEDMAEVTEVTAQGEMS